MPGREQLYASTFWGVRRPQFPLTPGHFVIRLADPSLAFGPDSAGDLLHCYGRLRQALTALRGATAAQLFISRNWSPVGDAIGEPLSETSTPTLHAFISWPGSPLAAAALRLPAHLRAATAPDADQDEALRLWSGSKGPLREPEGPTRGPTRASHAQDAAAAAQGVALWQSRAFAVQAAPAANAGTSRTQHWTAVPRQSVKSLDGMGTDALLELAAGVEQLAWNANPRHAGMTVWATDVWGGGTSIDIFGREHGQATNQLAEFVTHGGLGLEQAALRTREFRGPSPTVEK